jgi:hypothetical protein
MSDARGEARGARFDGAIDGAVREMLDVEPPADLRGRVLSRIDALATASAASAAVASAFPGLSERLRIEGRRKTTWIAVPLAAAAVIILAVLGPWRQPAPPVVTPASSSIANAQPTPAVVTRVEAPKPAPARRQRSLPPVGERMVVAAVTADDDGGTMIDPLSPIAPITVAPTRPADIAPTSIAVSPLAPIAELQMAPLSPPARRN